MQFFKLFKIVFGSVGIYGPVIRPLSDMYDIPDVTKPEENRRNVGDDIPAISYHEEVPEPFAYLAPEAPVHDARTAEAVTVNIFCNVGAVVHAKLVAK